MKTKIVRRAQIERPKAGRTDENQDWRFLTEDSQENEGFFKNAQDRLGNSKTLSPSFPSV
jgi:hypothetical protein